jgi:hypothetical protein
METTETPPKNHLKITSKNKENKNKSAQRGKE